MRRPSPIVVFALSAFAWIIVLTLVWSKVSPWTSYPAAALTQVALERGAPFWVRSVKMSPGKLQVETSVAVPVPKAGGRLGEIDVEADPGRYAYGLPIFLALLLAARDRHRLVKGLGGYLLLIPAQAFSATMFVLMELALAAGLSARTLAVNAWQVEAIVYGFQLGSLVVPTLVPIVLWLWLDRQFFTEVILPGWRGQPASQTRAAEGTGSPLRQAGGSGAEPRTGADPTPDAHSAQPSPEPVPEPEPHRRAPRDRGGQAASAEISASASAGLPPRK